MEKRREQRAKKNIGKKRKNRGWGEERESET